MAKKSSPEKSSPWDIKAFEQQVTGDSNWSTNSQKKDKGRRKVTRVQDLALSSLDTPPSTPPTSKNKKESNSNWPFDSSPCRMFGGKNTRRGGADDAENSVKNGQLFDTEFADRAAASKNRLSGGDPDLEDEEDETSIEDEIASEGPTVEDSGYDTDSFYNDGENDTNDGDKQAVDYDDPFAPKQRPVAELDDTVESPGRKKTATAEPGDIVRGHSASPDRGDREKRKVQKSKREASSHSTRTQTKPERKINQPKKPEKLRTAAERASMPSARSSSRRKSRSRSTDFASSSFHGASAGTGRSRVRPGVTRAKSTDKMGFVASGAASVHTWTRKGSTKRGGRDDLSVGSYHTVGGSSLTGRNGRSASTSRRGEGSSSRATKPSALDRRGRLSRAMSSNNVKRPEEYAGAQQPQMNKSSTSLDHSSGDMKAEQQLGESQHTTSEKRSKSSARRQSSTASVSSRESGGGKSSSRTAPPPKTQENGVSSSSSKPTTYETAEDEIATATTAATDDSSMSAAAPKPHPAMRRKKSARLGRSGSNRSLKSSSHHSKPAQTQVAATSAEPSSGVAHHNSVPAATAKTTARPSSPSHHAKPDRGDPMLKSSSRRSHHHHREKRDLLVVLTDRKTVQPADLMDKENRKLLHFLMYEHKMGISQKELYRRIQQEKASS